MVAITETNWGHICAAFPAKSPSAPPAFTAVEANTPVSNAPTTADTMDTEGIERIVIAKYWFHDTHGNVTHDANGKPKNNGASGHRGLHFFFFR